MRGAHIRGGEGQPTDHRGRRRGRRGNVEERERRAVGGGNDWRIRYCLHYMFLMMLYATICPD